MSQPGNKVKKSFVARQDVTCALVRFLFGRRGLFTPKSPLSIDTPPADIIIMIIINIIPNVIYSIIIQLISHA